MNIRLRDGLPFVSVSIAYQGEQLELHNCLLNTGSAGTIFSADHRIRGVGGAEFVFTKRVESLHLDKLNVTDFEVEIGGMDYGFSLDGIIGLDFLRAVQAIIDLNQLRIYDATNA